MAALVKSTKKQPSPELNWERLMQISGLADPHFQCE